MSLDSAVERATVGSGLLVSLPSPVDTVVPVAFTPAAFGPFSVTLMRAWSVGRTK